MTTKTEERVDFSPFFNADEHYCLRVNGDSMIDAQIADGDYVVVRRQSTCNDGDIVIANHDGRGPIIKLFYNESSRVRLQPANRKMKPIYSSHVEVLGVVKGVMRKIK